MFRCILAPVRLTEPDLAERSVAVASRLARDNDAQLILATITPHWVTVKSGDYSKEARRWFEERAALQLGQLKALTQGAQCRTLVRWGSIPGSIFDIAEETEADLIVLAAEEPVLAKFLRQSDPVRVAARAHCSVLLVR